MTMTLAPPAPAASPPAPLSLRRFSVAEYHHLIAQGFFARDERYELLDGYIVRKMPRDPIHDAILNQGRKVLAGSLPAGWHVRAQSTVTLSESEPEPDLAVTAGEELDYVARHPGPLGVAVVVEVSNTTLAEDRSWKGPIYARDRVAAYWIINLVDWRVEAYSDPSGPDAAPAYRRREDFRAGHTLPLPVPGATAAILVGELLPPQFRSAGPRQP